MMRPKKMSRRLPKYAFSNLVETQAAPILMSDTYLKPTILDWARFCEVDSVTIYRWIDTGVPEVQADRIAIKCVGMHPSLIWPEWFTGVPK